MPEISQNIFDELAELGIKTLESWKIERIADIHAIYNVLEKMLISKTPRIIHPSIPISIFIYGPALEEIRKFYYTIRTKKLYFDEKDLALTNIPPFWSDCIVGRTQHFHFDFYTCLPIALSYNDIYDTIWKMDDIKPINAVTIIVPPKFLDAIMSEDDYDLWNTFRINLKFLFIEKFIKNVHSLSILISISPDNLDTYFKAVDQEIKQEILISKARTMILAELQTMLKDKPEVKVYCQPLFNNVTIECIQMETGSNIGKCMGKIQDLVLNGLKLPPILEPDLYPISKASETIALEKQKLEEASIPNELEQDRILYSKFENELLEFGTGHIVINTPNFIMHYPVGILLIGPAGSGKSNLIRFISSRYRSELVKGRMGTRMYPKKTFCAFTCAIDNNNVHHEQPIIGFDLADQDFQGIIESAEILNRMKIPIKAILYVVHPPSFQDITNNLKIDGLYIDDSTLYYNAAMFLISEHRELFKDVKFIGYILNKIDLDIRNSVISIIKDTIKYRIKEPIETDVDGLDVSWDFRHAIRNSNILDISTRYGTNISKFFLDLKSKI